MINFDFDQSTSKIALFIIVAILLIVGLAYGGFMISKIVYDVQLEKVQLESEKQNTIIRAMRYSDSLRTVIAIKNYEIEQLYKLVDESKDIIKQRDENTFNAIENLRNKPDSIRYSEWADRFLYN